VNLSRVFRKSIASSTEEEVELQDTGHAKDDGKDMEQEPKSQESKPAPLRKGFVSVWRARCVTAYNPDLLPPEPLALQETVCILFTKFLGIFVNPLLY
jgi:hypothetical protein